MSTDNLDLAELRRIAEEVNAHESLHRVTVVVPNRSVTLTADETLALIDRIEALEAERDGLMVTNERLLSYSQKAEARVKEMEARLARVTDDSMAERIEQAWEVNRIVGGTINSSLEALATIRAVAADEQEGPEHTVACNAIWFDFGGCSCGATDEQEASDG